MKALVTGGGGFLGSEIVRQLIARGDQVRTVQRGDYPWMSKLGVEVIQGGVGVSEIAGRAVEGCDVVFHVAAKAGVWGKRSDYVQSNVQTTRALLQACGVRDVRRFVFTSSPSVTFSGDHESGVDESMPYPNRYLAHYPATKAQAEREVLAQNGQGNDDASIATVALRPHLIWGPGDRHLVPRIVGRAKAGKLKFVGDGSNLVDSTYVDNAAHAHLLAADKLVDEGVNAPCAGKAYFITNGEPLAMADLINRILDAAGLGPVTKSVSPRLAYVVGALLECVYGTFRIGREPIMTRFVAKQLLRDHWYDLTAAKRDLNYEPIVSIDEGMKRLATWLSENPI